MSAAPGPIRPASRPFLRVPRRTLLLALACASLACGVSSTEPTQRAAGDLHFLRPRGDAPAFASLTGAFYAKRGEDRGVALYYRAAPGATDSVAFLRFQVPARALVTRANGSVLADGDSVLITLAITDPDRMVVRFQPSGLRFATGKPARLQLSFREADDDFNGDGLVNDDDLTITSQLAIWVQEIPGAVWTRLASSLSADLKELDTDIAGFSGYAVAY